MNRLDLDQIIRLSAATPGLLAQDSNHQSRSKELWCQSLVLRSAHLVWWVTIAKLRSQSALHQKPLPSFLTRRVISWEKTRLITAHRWSLFPRPRPSCHSNLLRNHQWKSDQAAESSQMIWNGRSSETWPSARIDSLKILHRYKETHSPLPRRSLTARSKRSRNTVSWCRTLRQAKTEDSSSRQWRRFRLIKICVDSRKI